jgi:hypothetical protein
MSPTKLRKLQPVLDNPKQPVLLLQRQSVVSTQKSSISQCLDGWKCACFSNGFINNAVDELKELNGKFDIAQSAAAQLDVELFFLHWNLVNDAFAHLPGMLDQI